MRIFAHYTGPDMGIQSFDLPEDDWADYDELVAYLRDSLPAGWTVARLTDYDTGHGVTVLSADLADTLDTMREDRL